MSDPTLLQQLLDRLGDHTKAELQELAHRQDVRTKGTKDELIYRLVHQPRIELGTGSEEER